MNARQIAIGFFLAVIATVLLSVITVLRADVSAQITIPIANGIYGSNDAFTAVASVRTSTNIVNVTTNIGGTNVSRLITNTIFNTNWVISTGFLVIDGGSSITTNGTNAPSTNAWLSYFLLGTRSKGEPLTGVSSGSFVVGSVTNMFQTNNIPEARGRVNGIFETFTSGTNPLASGYQFQETPGGSHPIQRTAYYSTNLVTWTDGKGQIYYCHPKDVDPSLNRIDGAIPVVYYTDPTMGVNTNICRVADYVYLGTECIIIRVRQTVCCNPIENSVVQLSLIYWENWGGSPSTTRNPSPPVPPAVPVIP